MDVDVTIPWDKAKRAIALAAITEACDVFGVDGGLFRFFCSFTIFNLFVNFFFVVGVFFVGFFLGFIWYGFVGFLFFAGFRVVFKKTVGSFFPVGGGGDGGVGESERHGKNGH